jgi:homoserine kinase
MQSGAYGVAISGSGPTMIALCPVERAGEVSHAMVDSFNKDGVGCESYLTRVGRGVQII